ncbi:hypothetical protein CLV93_11321 [Prolixibacter denitrificans]|uniref:Uncharacterized protein n=1 Tax=Prolixibacter denitrificans TaxID=1541063 RepID=A0A2P8C723_9BACT|nr:hypothetical protein CLV93_11321 [Prolixibacter denitrificans]
MLIKNFTGQTDFDRVAQKFSCRSSAPDRISKSFLVDELILNSLLKAFREANCSKSCF